MNKDLSIILFYFLSGSKRVVIAGYRLESILYPSCFSVVVALEYMATTSSNLESANICNRTDVGRVFFNSSNVGNVWIDGTEILENPTEAKKKIGYLPEQPPLYPEMTVQEYLDFAAELKGIKKKADRKEQVRKAARRTGLEEVLPRLIRSLSKGYRQRVGIAQALLGAPQLIILDEPTVGLDPAQVIEIRRLIRELGKSHTVILSSHILSEVQAVCSQVLILSKGHLVAVGAPEQLAEKLNPGSRLRATALGGGQTVLKTVGSIPGIRKVEIESEADGQVTFTAESADASDRRAEVSRALSQAGCTVLALAAENRTLEEVFLALTENESETPSDEGEEKTE